MPAEDEMPSTLERSPEQAQQLWATVHDHAVEQYGEGERAHRTAFAALRARPGPGRRLRPGLGHLPLLDLRPDGADRARGRGRRLLQGQ